MKMDREDIMRILPHRPPFLFLDEILEFEKGKSISGRVTVTGNEFFFQGHFPGKPILPGVIMIEMMAQLGAVAVLSTVSNRWMYLSQCERVKFRRVVQPPADLHLFMEMLRQRSNYGTAWTWIEKEGKRVCEGKLSYALVEKENG